MRKTASFFGSKAIIIQSGSEFRRKSFRTNIELFEKTPFEIKEISF